MRGQFIIKYLEIGIIFGVLIVLIFLYADMKIDAAYYRLRIYELEEKQADMEALNQSYRNLVVDKIIESKISVGDIDPYIPDFEQELILLAIKTKEGVN